MAKWWVPFMFTILTSLALSGEDRIPTTLEGPFNPVTVPLDDNAFRGNEVDLPDDDPKVTRKVNGFKLEHIPVSLSSNYDSFWISWITGNDDKLPLPRFAASWLDDKTEYKVGDVATIKIKVLEDSFSDKNVNHSIYAMKFSLSVNEKKGNSTYISGVLSYFEGDPTNWKISLVPIRVGNYSIIVTEDNSGVADSTLHFSVSHGAIYPFMCDVSWMHFENEFVAGTKAYLSVVPKDAFGNNISSIDIPKEDYFTVFGSYENGTAAVLLDFKYNGWSELGFISLEFVPIHSGRLLLHVYGNNKNLSGSPLPFVVKSGSINIRNSLAKWKYESNTLQIFSRLEIFIYQNDQFGNLVPGFYAFDARVVEKSTNLTVPVGDLLFQDVEDGIQLLSFAVSEPGDFSLTIFSANMNETLSNMPSDFTVFTGYCHRLNSFVNGSGLTNSIAGRMSSFHIYLEDSYHNPSPIKAQWLHVHIVSKNGTINVRPIIFPLRNTNGMAPSSSPAESPTKSLSLFPALEDRTFIGKSSVVTSEFFITYIPEKIGEYYIWVICGNIPVNNSYPYLMKVSPGRVATRFSSVISFEPKVKKLVRNEIYVQLWDSSKNLVSSQKKKLSLDIEAAHSSSFVRWEFEENKDGTYVGYYLLKELGSFNVCVSYEEKAVSPCPFEVRVHERNYFSEAMNDSISVWEDESIAFDALANDYIPGGQINFTEISTPLHGSLLQYGNLFRYTPLIGYFGNDSYFYSFSDINQNVATGTVFISVLCRPPQFISLPAHLHVTEDIISPKFGGFSGFETMYSNLKENISVTIRAQSGMVFLAPMQMPIYHPFRNTLSVKRGVRDGKDLILSGHIEMINYALQWIQYLGNENFYGNDAISLYAMNQHGVEAAHVPVFVEPINDPPFINVPDFILLGMKEINDMQIYDKQKDVFNFSVGDTDIYSFPDNKSHLQVAFSLEVNEGVLSTKLPGHLIDTIEIKSVTNNQWQPLQTFVTISKHFFLKGKGFRFRGTIDDCNNAMQTLFYYGEHQNAILSITVNDMGNYGCYPDCKDMMSLPLFAEASVNLIRRKLTGSLTSLLLGSAIILEIVMMLLLGAVLLLFICRCINALYKGTRDNDYNKTEEDFETEMDDHSSQHMTSSNSSPEQLLLRRQKTNVQNRSSLRAREDQSLENDMPSFSQFNESTVDISVDSIELVGLRQ